MRSGEDSPCSHRTSLTHKQALVGHKRRSRAILSLSGPSLLDVHLVCGSSYPALSPAVAPGSGPGCEGGSNNLASVPAQERIYLNGNLAGGSADDLWDVKGVSTFLQTRGVEVQACIIY